jgi:TPR repeat protein
MVNNKGLSHKPMEEAYDNYIEAVSNLANQYSKQGTGETSFKAVEILTRASKLGNPKLLRMLGLLLVYRVSVRNYKRGVKYLTEAAYLGDVEAQKDLGEIYSYAQGFPSKSTMRKALYWFTQAADQGCKYSISQVDKILGG